MRVVQKGDNLILSPDPRRQIDTPLVLNVPPRYCSARIYSNGRSPGSLVVTLCLSSQAKNSGVTHLVYITKMYCNLIALLQEEPFCNIFTQHWLTLMTSVLYCTPLRWLPE